MAEGVGRERILSAYPYLEPEDLVALTVEAAAMAQVPLAGTNWIPGRASY
jgi:uncharacterized protein (DUF433 family)